MPNHCFGLREVCAVLAWSDARNAAAFAGYESEAMSDPCATVPPMQSDQTRQWKRAPGRIGSVEVVRESDRIRVVAITV